MKKKRILSVLIALTLSIVVFAGCGSRVDRNVVPTSGQAEPAQPAGVVPTQVSPVSAPVETETGIPRYIFLFIGDGMGYAQIQMASFYLGALRSNGGVDSVRLSFMDFPAKGSTETWDLTSFAPDSASAATSIASGIKTWSGTINYDSSLTVQQETIAEKLKAQLGYRVGIVTTVNLCHATPAAFYAKVPSRSDVYGIGQQLVASGFDYFAGGDFARPTGPNRDQPHLHDLARAAGYKVVTTYEDTAQLTPADGKAIVIAERLDRARAMKYALDKAPGEWTLADYTAQAIEMLYNDTGFFVMIESGKVDWAGHANDAAATLYDILAFDEAVKVALDFYAKYPDDTLIIVTGDHETGGLTIGFAGTNFDTFLTNISAQKVTHEVFGSRNSQAYRRSGTSFEEVLVDIHELFGLTTEENAAAAVHESLVLTEWELGLLRQAYDRTMAGERAQAENQAEYLSWGSHDPLTVTITSLVNNKSGIGWTSWSHTGAPVPVFALGVGADKFTGFYDNTDIFFKLVALTDAR